MKRFLSVLLSLAMLTCSIGTVSARTETGEKKSYIVVLEAPAVYSPDRVSFYSTDDNAYREALLELQAEIRAQIDGGASLFSLRSQERTYSYTDVLNGFTVNVDAKMAEKIKSIEGVADVCEDEIIDIVKPLEAESEETTVSTEENVSESVQISQANSGNMMNVQSAYDKGYNGQGRAIAVIDSCINPDHKYYKLSDNSTANYAQEDIAEILQNNTMKVSATAANAYKNTKIPYAYNYPQNSPVVTGPNLHGAHVAGIAAGNSVTVSDGVIQGVAPEAQILFFGMYHPDGTPTSDIVAALEDAVKFDVDAINISMGTDFASENHPSASALKTAVAACRNTGISVVFAAGNADRASYNAVMPDYSTSDNRTYKYSSKVGSVQAEYAYLNNAVVQQETAPRESSFSSYGYGDNLDIAVDFAAPGGNIFSSYGGTEGYANLSGTSMAAPQITGATSLMYQYVEEKFPNYTRAAKVALVKSLLASTAESVYTENGALSSPRKVGAGIVQLDKAMETKVMLRAINSNETKINLGADLEKSFSVAFNVFNLSNEAVTFNNIDVEVSTDDYKYYEGRGNCYYGRKKLDASVTGATSVTVPANQYRAVTVNITLSDEDISYLQTAMTNGFFIDGKVTLSGSTNCDVGIPFSGFYGDWSKLPIMNKNRVLDFFSLFGRADDGFQPQAMITKNESGELVMPIADSVDETISGISALIFVNPLRNAYATVKIDGETIIQNAFFNKECDLGYWLGTKTLGDFSSASEIVVELRLPYYNDTSKNQSFTIKMVKDNTPPVISDMYVSEDGSSVYVAVSDNYGISAVSAYGLSGDEWNIDDAYINKESATAEFEMGNYDEIHYIIYDSAFNMTAFEPHIGIDVESETAIFTNNTHEHLSGDCMIAVYENGKMTDFKKLSVENFILDAYDTKEFDISAYAEKQYKLFFWGKENGVKPLCDAYYIK